MYFQSHNNFYHGIMFHHFHDDKIHKRGQGSIDQDIFYKLIKFIGRENILNADEFFHRFKENKLSSKNLCLTFDDGIRCQYDVALPVLEDLKIKSFFFVYSSLFKNSPDLLEIYRYFRMNYFDDVNDFYNEFNKNIDADLNIFFNNKDEILQKNKTKFPFYSIADIKFRLVRDKLLTKEEYKKIMFKMFKSKSFVPEDYYQNLFLSSKNLIQMKKMGHLIGLHSHSHPYLLENLNYKQQLSEYQNNIKILSDILKIDKSDIKFMSHPSGSYNKNTLTILTNLGIELGFKQTITIETHRGMKKINNTSLEIAREDHATILKKINE